MIAVMIFVTGPILTLVRFRPKMKGIAHFAAGICAATFIPGVVESAAAGSVLIALGGIAGLLPDTLDFKFARYFERHDDEIELGADPQQLDPQGMAERIAAQMNAVLEGGEPRTVQLHTLRLGADLWRRYTVQFRPGADQVVVQVGPAVTTGQRALPGSGVKAEGQARVNGRIHNTYNEQITVDIFSGPSFRFESAIPPAGGDGVRVLFLPWHRRWSHSLTLAAALGVLAWALLGWRAGAVAAAGMAAHILEDQLGYMGSNLFWPLTRRRLPGLRLIHSGDALPNMAAVWIALMLTLWNLDRFGSDPALLPGLFLPLAVGLPLLLAAAGTLWQQRHPRMPHTHRAAQEQAEILAESERIQP